MGLPYRVLWAVASLDAVLLYDSQAPYLPYISPTSPPYLHHISPTSPDISHINVLNDSQASEPLLLARSMHYAALSDVAWLPNGRGLLLTRTPTRTPTPTQSQP